MKKILKNQISNQALLDDQKGIAAIEFALVAPVFIILLLGSVDAASYLIAHQKISRSAYTVSNLMTQMDKGLSESQVSDMMLSLDRVSSPFDVSESGVATVTAIIGEGTDGAAPDNYKITWKRCYGANSSTSSYGDVGDTISIASGDIPDDMIASTSQILVITEVEYNFEPIFGFIPFTDKIKYSSFFRPRRGAIENIVNDGSAAYTCS